MTAVATWLVVATVVVAVADWVAVARAHRVGEYVCKPLTMVVLIAAALALDPANGTERGWFVVALALSLVGDVFLMLPDQQRWFVPGLASFLLGHIAYIVGLIVAGLDDIAVAVGAAIVVVGVVAIAPRLLRGAASVDRRLVGPVGAYVAVISAMVTCAIGSTWPVAIVGAALFYLSDLTIGWSRFVADFRGARLVIITTYHAAQVLLVLSLVVSR